MKFLPNSMIDIAISRFFCRGGRRPHFWCRRQRNFFNFQKILDKKLDTKKCIMYKLYNLGEPSCSEFVNLIFLLEARLMKD